MFEEYLNMKKAACQQAGSSLLTLFHDSLHDALIVSTTDIFRILLIGPVMAAAAETIITITITTHSIIGICHTSFHLAVIAHRYR